MTKRSPKGTPRPTLLLDGDIIVYKTCAAAETLADWGDSMSLTVDLASVRKSIEAAVEGLRKDTNTDRVLFVLNGSGNFRTKLFPMYKSNRAMMRRPLALASIREWAMDASRPWQSASYDGIETDDTLGILATRLGPGKHVLASADKDFLTVPCTLYQHGELIEVSQADADRRHLVQTMTGDTADGYPGCPGMGPTKAEKLLDGLTGRAAWEAVVGAFAKKGLTEDHALTQARLAFILRSSHWDGEAKKPVLWEAPTYA